MIVKKYVFEKQIFGEDNYSPFCYKVHGISSCVRRDQLCSSGCGSVSDRSEAPLIYHWNMESHHSTLWSYIDRPLRDLLNGFRPELNIYLPCYRDSLLSRPRYSLLNQLLIYTDNDNVKKNNWGTRNNHQNVLIEEVF